MSDEWLAISEAIFRAEQVTGVRIPENALLAAVDRGAVRTEEFSTVRSMPGGAILPTWESTGRVAWSDVIKWIEQPSSDPAPERGAGVPRGLLEPAIYDAVIEILDRGEIGPDPENIVVAELRKDARFTNVPDGTLRPYARKARRAWAARH